MPRTSLSPSYVRFTMGNYPTNASRVDRHCRKLGQQSPHILYLLESFNISRYICTAWCSFSLGHVVGQMQGVCFMSLIGLDLKACIIHPSPSFSAWYVHLVSGVSGIKSDQTSTAQWKSVKFYRYLATRPDLHVN